MFYRRDRGGMHAEVRRECGNVLVHAAPRPWGKDVVRYTLLVNRGEGSDRYPLHVIR